MEPSLDSLRTVLREIGHLGGFAGAYVVGAVVCVWQLGALAASTGHAAPSWDLLLAAGLIATGTYALDRVKLRTSWMDPADRAAQPERYAFLDAHCSVIRWGAAACLGVGAVLGTRVHVLAPVAAALAAVGVVAYAPHPRRDGRQPRIKDRLGIKNVYVAAGIAGFGALAALADAARYRGGWTDILHDHPLGLLPALVVVGFRVVCDAALCDLDDEQSDRLHGTRTLPTVVGGERVWRWMGLARACTLALILACVRCSWRVRIAWALVGAAGIVAIRVRRSQPKRVRDFVDVRFAIEAAAATAVLLLWRG